MFVFDPLSQGLELLAHRELQGAEQLFLQVINDPYAQTEDLDQARIYLNEVRACQAGQKNLDFDCYKQVARKSTVSLDPVIDFLASIYFSSAQTYQEIDRALENGLPQVVNRLKQIKIRDIITRDELFSSLDNKGVKRVKGEMSKKNGSSFTPSPDFDVYKWKTVYRKFIQKINPILLERHLEMLEYILDTGNMELLDDPKITFLTPKYRWIIESTVKSKWYLLRSYFFKAKSEIREQFQKKEGTRKYWEEVKYKKIEIFEASGFHERNIHKFLYIDKLNYKTLEEIFRFAKSMNLDLVPRDVSLALRGNKKAIDHIKERGGHLLGTRKEFQDQLMGFGFSKENAYKIARQAKRANSQQIVSSFKQSLQVACDEIYWYRVLPESTKFLKDLEVQCFKHLSTVRIHLFERGRLNKLLLLSGKSSIRQYLIQVYGPEVVSLHCYFRLETIHQYYKLKFFSIHTGQVPSVSELIKISRKEFKPMLIEGYNSFLKKRRLSIPKPLYKEIENHHSRTGWEDPHTTPEEKLLLRFWFLMDCGISITQGVVNKGVLSPSTNLLEFLQNQGKEFKS